jgi:hypothetical protein
MGEIEAAVARAPVKVVLPSFPQPVLQAGYRDGTPLVQLPRQRFDCRPPLLPVANWTPWGWYEPRAGQTMENF